MKNITLGEKKLREALKGILSGRKSVRKVQVLLMYDSDEIIGKTYDVEDL